MLVVEEAESVRHHDQERALVEEDELQPEEARVLLRLPPQRVGGAEVGRDVDDRDLDRIAGGARALRDLLEPVRDGLRDRRLEREKDVLRVEDIARRISVRARTGRRRQSGERGDDEDEREAQDQAGLSSATARAERPRTNGQSRTVMNVPSVSSCSASITAPARC